jgi:hypothetical protein
MSEGGEPSAPATPGLIPLSYTTPWDAAYLLLVVVLGILSDFQNLQDLKRFAARFQLP